MATRVLVTGGAGFIGSHVVDSLLGDSGKRYKVLVVDNFDPFYDRAVKEKNIAGHRKSDRWAFVEADVRDAARLDRIFAEWRPELVVHLAAKAGVRPSVRNPREYVDVNVVGTMNVLDASVRYGVRKFVFASSSSVYGLNEKVPFSEEDTILRPASPYGATKIAGEALCRSYSRCYGLPAVVLRFFTVYGPRQRPDLAIHKFARCMLKGEPIPVYGDGSTSRDYTYIDDIIAGVRAAMDYEPDGCEVFNLGGDRPVRLIDMIRMLERILGRKAVIDRQPPQVGDVPATWADLGRARRFLGYEPKTPLEEGLRRFVEWLFKAIEAENAGVRRETGGSSGWTGE